MELKILSLVWVRTLLVTIASCITIFLFIKASVAEALVINTSGTVSITAQVGDIVSSPLNGTISFGYYPPFTSEIILSQVLFQGLTNPVFKEPEQYVVPKSSQVVQSAIQPINSGLFQCLKTEGNQAKQSKLFTASIFGPMPSEVGFIIAILLLVLVFNFKKDNITIPIIEWGLVAITGLVVFLALGLFLSLYTIVISCIFSFGVFIRYVTRWW